MAAPITAIYRATPADDWLDAEIIGHHPMGFVLREVGKFWPGIWLATIDQVRVPIGIIEVPEIVPRKYLPPGANRQGKYRTIREVCGREEALRQAFAP